MTLNITSYDPIELKDSLVKFFESRPGFEDFNYEGSAINTILDTLVRNTHYIAYMANMVATESFLDSAQLRANIVSHAQKLTYTPISRTASTMVVDIVVTPATAPTETTIVCAKNSAFIYTLDGTSYSFINTEDVTLVRGTDNKFRAFDVELKQGSINTQRFLYSRETGRIQIQNKNIDTSTLKVYVRTSQTDTINTEFGKLANIVEVKEDSNVYYLSENTRGYYEIEFGKDVLGTEPPDDAVIECEYVVVEDEHANGLKSLLAAFSVGGYSNVSVTVKTEAYGGAERQSNSLIKFLAPKIRETQERAVKEQDYAVLVMRDFPFVKSAIAWGGERNVPPYYGRVFVSAIPQEGYIIADSVKSVIENHMKKYSLLRVEITDVNYIHTDIVFRVIYNKTKTSLSFEQLKTQIYASITNYANQIKTFDRWFNNTEIERLIQLDNPVVISIEHEKVMYVPQQANVGTNTLYETNFINEIVPGSLVVENVKTNILSEVETLKDDKNGKLILTVDNVEYDVGTVNYETGEISFKINQLVSAELKIVCTPATENIYTDRNYVVDIANASVELLR